MAGGQRERERLRSEAAEARALCQHRGGGPCPAIRRLRRPVEASRRPTTRETELPLSSVFPAVKDGQAGTGQGDGSVTAFVAAGHRGSGRGTCTTPRHGFVRREWIFILNPYAINTKLLNFQKLFCKVSDGRGYFNDWKINSIFL